MSIFGIIYRSICEETIISHTDIAERFLSPSLQTNDNAAFSETLLRFVESFSPQGLDLTLMGLKEDIALFSQEIAHLGLRRRSSRLTHIQKRYLNDKFALNLCCGLGLYNQITHTVHIGKVILKNFITAHKKEMGSFRHRLAVMHLNELEHIHHLWSTHLKRSFMLSNIGCYAGVSPLSHDAAGVMYQFLDVLETPQNNGIAEQNDIQKSEAIA